MTLTEALKIVKNAPKQGPGFRVQLACGFTPLHLSTLLTAHLQQALPDRLVELETGLYGNLAGTLEATARHNLEATTTGQAPDAVAVALEWSDLDPRLGYRQLGGWGPGQEADIVSTVRQSCARVASAIAGISQCPVAVSLPTIPLAPIFHTAGWQAGGAEWELEAAIVQLAQTLARQSNVVLASRARFAEVSPERLNLKTDLHAGLPYPMEHASAVAEVLALLVHPPAPKKGLITDLDDTFWHGLVGEVGPEAVSWDLENHQQIHGLYQQMLKALAESGVLVGVASKNDAAVVEQAFQRDDLACPSKHLFPVEAHWNAKSGSVHRILKTWNIAADAVVFIDDSPIELAEVEAAHPGITCIQFPKNDPQASGALLRRLRDLFGKSKLAEEDAYRLDSIRQAAEFQQISVEQGGAPEQLLAGLNAEIGIDLDASEPRVLELVNKTNQFNLNGVRHTEAEWERARNEPGSFVAAVTYKDKFGPLGTIAVVQGSAAGAALQTSLRTLKIQSWVMSCRSFARRVEHQCLATLFDHFGAEEALLNYAPTAKNGPLRDFLCQVLEISADQLPGDAAQVRIPRKQFEQSLPTMYHSVALRGPVGSAASE